MSSPTPAAWNQQPAGHRAGHPAPSGHPEPPRKRPGALLALLATGLLTVLASVIGSVVVFTGGEDLAKSNLEEILGVETLGEVDAFTQILVDEHRDTLLARAGLVLFCAALLLLWTLLAHRGATWARVLTTIFAAFALLSHLMHLGGDEPSPGSVTLFSYVAIVGCVAVIVCCWLPATNAYARARKAAKLAGRAHP
ncbi:hypothetical protein [Streptomyces sp. B6B3]|uniref:hypothetical protein n=1 Tax=Streptomyces sp. B6B3 TaxID=3153570 RepID=UPI00325C9EB1